MPDIFLDGAARFLLVLHACAAIVLIGSTTHHAIIAFGYLRGTHKQRLGRIYAATIAVTYVITFGFGLLVYPTFRYHVRGLFLDRYDRWASNLFGMFLLSRAMSSKDDRHLVGGYVALAWLTAFIVWFDVIAGLIITNVRGIP
jgi:hypothetical protein